MKNTYTLDSGQVHIEGPKGQNQNGHHRTTKRKMKDQKQRDGVDNDGCPTQHGCEGGWERKLLQLTWRGKA